MTLNIGDPAPDFTLVSAENQLVSLNNYLGKNIILYFYPKDNTPGCTQQACEFRDAQINFTHKNAVIIGISKDSLKRHQQFIQQYNLPFTLLTDPEAKVCELYGVVNPKSLWGKSFLGITRSTFLINDQGYIRAIWRKVKVSGHINEVLNVLQQLS